jgi:hypothetical protein
VARIRLIGWSSVPSHDISRDVLTESKISSAGGIAQEASEVMDERTTRIAGTIVHDPGIAIALTRVGRQRRVMQRDTCACLHKKQPLGNVLIHRHFFRRFASYPARDHDTLFGRVVNHRAVLLIRTATEHAPICDAALQLGSAARGYDH